MKIPKFLKSKINWSAFLIVLIGLNDYITTLDFNQMTVKGWITFAIGILIFIFRTYFNNPTRIGGGTIPPPKNP